MAQLKRWSVAIFLGAIAGVLIASRVTGDVLSAVFGVVALLVAIKMLLPLEGRYIAEAIPSGPGGQLLPFAHRRLLQHDGHRRRHAERPHHDPVQLPPSIVRSARRPCSAC